MHLRVPAVWRRRIGVIVFALAFINGETFENEFGSILRRFAIQLDEAGVGIKSLDSGAVEVGEHHLILTTLF